MQRTSAVCRSILLLALSIPTAVFAQSVGDIFNGIRGLAQTAVSRAEWQKLTSSQLACINAALSGQGESFQHLAIQGVRPSDRRIAGLVASCTNATSAQSLPAIGSGGYVVNGIQLGRSVQDSDLLGGQYQCGASKQFPEFKLCSKTTGEAAPRGHFESFYSLLVSKEGKAVYVNRYLNPAWFSEGEANDDVNGRSKKYGPPARVIPMPKESPVSNGMIVVWGNVVLEQLGPSAANALDGGAQVGLIIDHLGNFARSAQLGLPIYRLMGGAGYVWAASWNEAGVGTLRFLTVDASALPSQIPDRVVERTTDPSKPDQQPLQRSEDKAKIDQLIEENRALKDAQINRDERLKRQRDEDEQTLSRTNQALDRTRKSADDARAEAEKAVSEIQKARDDAELANRSLKEQNRTYQILAVGEAFTFISLIAFSFLAGRRRTTNRSKDTDTCQSNRSVTVEKPRPQQGEIPTQKEAGPRSVPLAQAAFGILIAVALIGYATSSELRTFCSKVMERAIALADLNNLVGPDLKVWTEDVYLDPSATQPLLVLNIQNRGNAPILLTGASVNDNPNCFPQYNVRTSEVAINNILNGFMEMMIRVKGINILQDGYSKELKLGEIEKLSLGSSAFGGCSPVKVVVETNRGSSTFNFK